MTAHCEQTIINAPLAVYVHWPFCLSKCPYCDFNSHVRESVEHTAWREALLAEISYYAATLPHQQVSSIFFGGGTPSLMHSDTVAAVIDAICQHWQATADIEITLEANPTSSEIAKFTAFAEAGVNRVSLGVQALDDDVLQFLGRTHSAKHALQAVEMAAQVFGRYSFDLIYARPNQTLQQWRQELTQALAYAGEHLSLYQLTIEPGTAFYHAHARGDLIEIDENSAAGLYVATQEILCAHGLPAYEISNHARKGAESRHNMTYWRYGDYIGVGPGAHGRITTDQKFSTLAYRSPEKWLKNTQAYGHGIESQTALSTEEQMHEQLLMGLRLDEGVKTADFKRASGHSLYDIIHPAMLHKLVDAGWAEATEKRLRIIGEGRLCLNSIIAELII
ncbi:MAG: radical SAM family heme chaperone HemW [Alphaproteobacteria bacterium]|nr:radical SAM family heme chaperone HemW [Alphaproteobacteria bacterium]